MSIPALRPPPPSLPVAIGVLGAGNAIVSLLFAFFRANPEVWTRNGRLWTLISLGSSALSIGAAIVASAGALSLLRMRRSPGAALTAAAFTIGALCLCVWLVVQWMWPWGGMLRGWRYDAYVVCDWAYSVVFVLATVGLCAAGWADRGVRLIASAAIGAALLAHPLPWVLGRAYQWVEFDLYKWDTEYGDYMFVPDARVWVVPSVLAVARLAWAGAMIVLVTRQPPIPADTVAPRPPAAALRRLAVSFVVMVAVALAAGITIALVQGKPADGTGPLSLLIPIVVGVATAGVGAALIDVAVTDVVPAAARRAGAAAICVLWCVAVVAAQTLASQRPKTGGPMNPLLFAIFEPPWMPGMVGAAVAVMALLNINAALTHVAAQAGQPPSRAQNIIILLALVIGALTTPWVLGFGTRSLEMDTLRIATLASAALVNLAAWIALARCAWRTANAFDEAVIASAP